MISNAVTPGIRPETRVLDSSPKWFFLIQWLVFALYSRSNPILKFRIWTTIAIVELRPRRQICSLSPKLFWILMVLLCSAHGRADSFGRFGYGCSPGLPDLAVSGEGFWSKFPGSTHFNFLASAVHLSASSTQSTAQTCDVDGPATLPRKIRTSLIGNSVDLLFTNGISLVCKTESAPYLSWSDRSVGPGVPTEPVKWILVSFSQAEPPLVFGLSGGTASFQVTGTKGAWILSAADFSGWMRIWLPLGLDPQFANEASGLGKIMKDISPFADVWQSESPTASAVSVKANESSVDATWKFKGTGIFLPQAVVMARLGGSALEVLSEHRQLPGAGPDPPREVVDGSSLTIHFPCLRIRPGRAVGLGSRPHADSSSVPNSVDSIVALANQTLLASGDDAMLKLSDDTVTRFLTDTVYTPEPNTHQQLPYAVDGAGLTTAAAQAYLAQCAMVALGSTQPNALFDSILWRRDWWTWKIWAQDEATSRGATALAALVGALSASPEARFYGSTLEAGLDAERGIEIWRARKQHETPKALDDPLLGLRVGLFFLARSRETSLDFFHLIQSPLKVAAGPSVRLANSGSDYVLDWTSVNTLPSVLTFLDPPVNTVASPGENVDKLKCLVQAGALRVEFRPVVAGRCRLKVAFAANPPVFLPLAVDPPIF